RTAMRTRRVDAQHRRPHPHQPRWGALLCLTDRVDARLRDKGTPSEPCHTMLAIPEGRGLKQGQFMQEVRQGKAGIAFNPVDAVLVSPVDIEGPKGLGVMAGGLRGPGMRPDVDGPTAAVVTAARVDGVLSSLLQARQERF